MKLAKTKGVIYTKDKYNIKYAIAKIEYENYEDGKYKYIFTPYYNILDIMKNKLYQGIPGINLDTRKEVYIRENMTPTFIGERSPQKNREELWELLDEVGMDYLNRLEWLIRTDKTYSGDNLFVERFHEPIKSKNFENLSYGDTLIVNKLEDLDKRNNVLTKKLLSISAIGANLECDDFVINNQNRSICYQLLSHLYRNSHDIKSVMQKKGIINAKGKGKYKGRKRIEVDIITLDKVIKDMKKKKISELEAMDLLNIKSRSTLYRRIKEFKIQ